jgi:RNA polymerase sigma-70 factor (ECF subfamily)
MPHVLSLLRVARRLSRDRTAAEDLVQETMLRAGAATSSARARTRARGGPASYSISSTAERRLRTELHARRPAPERRTGLIEAVELNKALAALTPEHRAVLLLAVVEGFTCQEIAGILLVPIGTVMSRLSRARQALRERLAPGTPCGKGGTL